MIVINNNPVRRVIGDKEADERLQEVEKRVEEVQHIVPFWRKPSRVKLYDFARERRVKVQEAVAADPYTSVMEGMATSSMDAMTLEVEDRCEKLLQAAARGEGIWAGGDQDASMADVGAAGLQAPPAAGEGQGEGGDEGQGEGEVRAAEGAGGVEAGEVEASGFEAGGIEAGGIEAGHNVGKEEEALDDEPTFPLLDFDPKDVEGIANVARELQEAFGVTLDPDRECLLPRLHFVPPGWGDREMLSYAGRSNDLADFCDGIGSCPPSSSTPGEGQAQ